MNHTFNLNEHGDVIETYGDLMRILKSSNIKTKPKPKPVEEDIPMGKAILLLDLPKKCYDCPLCDDEFEYCRALKGVIYCLDDGRLEECPLIPVNIEGIDS